MIGIEINGITNPADYIDPTTATASMEDTLTGGFVDQGSYNFGKYLFVKSYINLFQARALDLTNGKFPVKYSFTLQPKGRVA